MFISYYAAVFLLNMCFRCFVQKTIYSCYFPPIFHGFNCLNHFCIVLFKSCRILLISLRGYCWFFCFSLFLKFSSTYCVRLCSLFIVLIVLNWLAWVFELTYLFCTRICINLFHGKFLDLAKLVWMLKWGMLVYLSKKQYS